MKSDQYPQVVFPQGFDARWEAELPDKGYIDGVVVELGAGTRYELNFIDPTRLRQERAIEAESGHPYFMAPNCVVLNEVTRSAVEERARALFAEGFFENLKPLDDPIPHPVPIV